MRKLRFGDFLDRLHQGEVMTTTDAAERLGLEPEEVVNLFRSPDARHRITRVRRPQGGRRLWRVEV